MMNDEKRTGYSHLLLFLLLPPSPGVPLPFTERKGSRQEKKM
jgi:hypothetical protein